VICGKALKHMDSTYLAQSKVEIPARKSRHQRDCSEQRTHVQNANPTQVSKHEQKKTLLVIS